MRTNETSIVRAFLMVAVSSALISGCAFDEGDPGDGAMDEEGAGETDAPGEAELLVEDEPTPQDESLAAQASAVLKCTGTQRKLIAMPVGDTEVWLQECVRSDGAGEREAATNIQTMHTTAFPGDENKLFYYFRVEIRLEHNDGDYEVVKCNYTGQANQPGWYGPYTCKSGALDSNLRGGWTADGYVEWDVIGDGLGRQTWQLQGSPAIN